jgi:hypothetical protein
MLYDVVSDLEGIGAQVVVDEAPAPDGVDGLLEVHLDDRTVRFAVEVRRRCPYPGELGHLLNRAVLAPPGALPLLAAPGVSEGVAERLVAAGWSWADGAGSFDLRSPGLRLRQRAVQRRPGRPASTSLPRGHGSWSVIRSLIAASGPVVKVDHLKAIGHVTDGRVYQILEKLSVLGLGAPAQRGYWQPDKEF